MASRDSKKLAHQQRIALVRQFCSVTGADKTTAKRVLDVCNYNVEVAINMHVEADEPSSTTTAASALADSSSSSSSSGAMAAPSPEVSSLRKADGPTSSSVDGDDGVRAPIPPVRGILVGPSYVSSTAFRTRRRPPRSVFDGFRDFEAETRQQEQALWNNGGDGGSSTSSQKRKTLEDLFRPPLDVMHKGTFDSVSPFSSLESAEDSRKAIKLKTIFTNQARDCGQTTNRWLMVNIQNVQEFPCQVLNRDVWSNEAVKSIIREHFVFWQVYHDSEEGERYMQFYKIAEWPYVAIIDPRTGENMITWTKLDSLSFFDLVTAFLTVHPSLDGSSSSSSSATEAAAAPPAAKRQRLESILDASEDSQMEAAIKASLTETLSDGNRQLTKANRNNKNVVNDNEAVAVVNNPVRDSDDDDDEMDDLETFESDSENSITRVKQTEGKNGDEVIETSEGRLKASDDGTVTDGVVSWEKYLGSKDDPKSSLAIRFPDGSKEQLNVPSTSKLKALLLYVESKGFSRDKFGLVTNFPKRRIDTMDGESSLREVGLFPQETVFVQSQ